jgi:glucose-6-phosphate-specific signal transduction histidine kinase
MLNSGDQLLVEIFYLLLPGIILFVTVLLVSFFYVRRFNRIMRRYKIQKLAEVENERKRIANDLHDFVGSKLLKIKSELHDSLHKSNEPVYYDNVAQGISELNKFHDDLRYLVEYIYPKELMSGNVRDGFLRLADDMSNATTEIIMDIEFEHQPSRNVMHQLYRLLQEKISNIVTHERPPKIFIGLYETIEDKEGLLSISYLANHPNNSKITKSKRRSGGRGLFIIKERLKVLKARIQSEYDDGFYKENIIFPID